MATKKTATKKTTTSRVTSKKSTKPSVARAPRKSSASTRVSTRKAEGVKSFRVAKDNQPFMAFRLTRQTFYWLVLSAMVLGLALWVIDINNKVQEIYDQIDASSIQQQELDQRELEILREKYKKDK